MMPEVAPGGTVTLISDAVEAVTAAFIPLNLTSFPSGIAAKLEPEMVTVVATGPIAGEKEEMAGTGCGSLEQEPSNPVPSASRRTIMREVIETR